MKNNKPTTYILLTLVIAIWGYVIYTIISKTQDDRVIIDSPSIRTMVSQNLDYYTWKDPLPYDSILHTPFATQDLHLASQVEDELIEDYDAEEYIDPIAFAPALDIAYLGFIENQNKKQRIAILQVNGKQQYIATNQTIDNIKLLQINESNILIKTDFQTLTIDKQ